MDLNKMLTYKATLEKLLNNDFDYYSLNLINDGLLLLSSTEYKSRLVTSLNKLIDQVNVSINDIPNKALLNHSIGELINQNKDIKEFAVTIFNSGIVDFTNIELLPKGYSFNKENIIIDLSGNLIFDDETILKYVKREYLPFIGVFIEMIELTNFSLLEIKDQVKRNEKAAVKDSLNTELSDLTAFEVALKHYVLEQAKEAEYLTGKAIIEKYGQKKVEIHLNKIRNDNGVDFNRKGIKQNLLNVKSSLGDFPHVQKSIDNYLDKPD